MEERNFVIIDIGSNAMRASLAIVDKSNDIEILKSYRYPLRLGEDTFNFGKISKKKLKKTDEAFSDLIEQVSNYKLEKVLAVATSAIRDSENGMDLIKKVKDNSNINIEIIDGMREAKLITKAISSYLPIKNKLALLIDIGGGSTEVILTENSKVLYAKSFQCGTVRLLELKRQNKLQDEIHALTKELQKDLKNIIGDRKIEVCAGTGGNLRRIGKLRKTFFQRNSSKIFQHELIAIKQEVNKFSIEQRMNFLNMRLDRADVIVPAMDIVEDILIKFDIQEIQLPSIGLKEGILIDYLGQKPRSILF